MKKFLKTFALVSSMSIVATIANADQFVRMVSGPSGGSWYPLGAKVMQTLESNIKGISTSNTSRELRFNRVLLPVLVHS